MPQTTNPFPSPPEPVLAVLVVATEALARARLAAQVRHALPSAQIHQLSHVTDLVYRVAGSDVGLVLLDAELAQPLPPLLVQMLKGIQPTLRIVSVAPSELAASAAPAAACIPAADASLAGAGLCDWLRTHYGAGHANLAASTSPAHLA